ncbi:hypothetical protein TNCV_348201 [Trichonephila clavipes]|nr:hypothetical protein TNCV_348201 [Trichonephila clavipes]
MPMINGYVFLLTPPSPSIFDARVDQKTPYPQVHIINDSSSTPVRKNYPRLYSDVTDCLTNQEETLKTVYNEQDTMYQSRTDFVNFNGL